MIVILKERIFNLIMLMRLIQTLIYLTIHSLLLIFKCSTLYSLSNMHFKRAFWKKLLSISKSDASIVKIGFSSKISNDVNPCKLKIETQIYWQLLQLMQIGYIYEIFLFALSKKVFLLQKSILYRTKSRQL